MWVCNSVINFPQLITKSCFSIFKLLHELWVSLTTNMTSIWANFNHVFQGLFFDVLLQRKYKLGTRLRSGFFNNFKDISCFSYRLWATVCWMIPCKFYNIFQNSILENPKTAASVETRSSHSPVTSWASKKDPQKSFWIFCLSTIAQIV